jgi:hypothetical protein
MCRMSATHPQYSPPYRVIPLPSASQYSYQPATPLILEKEFEMELLIGFVTTLCISLLIFRK